MGTMSSIQRPSEVFPESCILLCPRCALPMTVAGQLVLIELDIGGPCT
jgi:hypothetical protein